MSSRLLGLENEDEDGEKETTKTEVSTNAPCVGLCHVERVQEMEKDDNLKQLKKEKKECVGLCYILRFDQWKEKQELFSLIIVGRKD